MIDTVIMILNVKIAAMDLFGINFNCPKGGICSDKTTVFTTPVETLFDNTMSLSCYIHIIRKFFMDGIDGNGQYY